MQNGSESDNDKTGDDRAMRCSTNKLLFAAEKLNNFGGKRLRQRVECGQFRFMTSHETNLQFVGHKNSASAARGRTRTATPGGFKSRPDHRNVSIIWENGNRCFFSHVFCRIIISPSTLSSFRPTMIHSGHCRSTDAGVSGSVRLDSSICHSQWHEFYLTNFRSLAVSRRAYLAYQSFRTRALD